MVLVFTAIYLFVIFQFVTTPFFSWVTVIPVFFTWMQLWVFQNEWMVLLHQPKIVCKSGVSVTLFGKIKLLPGNQGRAMVWMKHRVWRDLPNKEKIYMVEQGWGGFRGMFSGDVLVAWTLDTTKLKMLTNSELPEGGYYYDGGIGVELPSEHVELVSKISHLDFLLSKQQDVMERARKQVNLMSKSQDKGVLQAAQTLGTILKETNEGKRPYDIQTQAPQLQYNQEGRR